MREARAAAATASGGSEDLEAEVQALFDELSTQRAILDRCAHNYAAIPQRQISFLSQPRTAMWPPLMHGTTPAVHSVCQPGRVCAALWRHFAVCRRRVPPFASRAAAYRMWLCALVDAVYTQLSAQFCPEKWWRLFWRPATQRLHWQQAQAGADSSACASNSAGHTLCRETYWVFCLLFRYRIEESAVRAELKKISDERQRVKALQDEAYGRIVGARNEKRDKSRVWGDNRLVFQPQKLTGMALNPERLVIGSCVGPSLCDTTHGSELFLTLKTSGSKLLCPCLDVDETA